MVKYADDKKNRDLKMVKECDTCGEKYHPRKNSYQAVSRFCSAVCARKGLRGTMQASYGKKRAPSFED